MAWVRSEYAGEFAVISAWVAMVLPWNVVYHSNVPTQRIRSVLFSIRLSVLELQFRFPGEITLEGEVIYTATDSFDSLFSGVGVVSNLFVTAPPAVALHHDGALGLAGLAWSVGSLALLGAFGISLAFYFRDEEFLERSPFDPVRGIGWLLAVATVATAAASVLYFLERDVAGIPIPIGVPIMGVLAVTLLRIDRDGDD